VTTDVGFLFSIVAVSMSLSSLAGLVIAFRRTGTWAAYDVFRLRQIVEWGFANALVALAPFPLAGALGSEATALRALGAISLSYIIANLFVLKYRIDHLPQRIAVRYSPVVLVIDIALLMLSTATAILGSSTAVEALLLGLVMRPMLAFLFVLATLGRESG
jgi:hypothetical protein